MKAIPAAEMPADTVQTSKSISAARPARLSAGTINSMAISDRFFVIGTASETREIWPAEDERKEPDMSETAEIAATDARITEMLLMELVEAMQARGALKREDIAGALLRMEWRASLADDMAEDGDITHHLERAALSVAEWEERFGLPPELHTLRKAHQDWAGSGRSGPNPLYPDQVIELYEQK